MTMTDSDDCLIIAINGHESFDVFLDNVLFVRFVLKVLDHSNPLLSHVNPLRTQSQRVRVLGEPCSPHTTRLRIELLQQ